MSNLKWPMGLHLIPYPSTLRFSPNGIMPCVTCEPHLSSMFDFLIDLHVAPLKPLTRCQVSRTTPVASKNMKFRLLQLPAFNQMNLSPQMLNSVKRILSGFNCTTTATLGDITLPVQARPVTQQVLFSVVDDLGP